MWINTCSLNEPCQSHGKLSWDQKGPLPGMNSVAMQKAQSWALWRHVVLWIRYAIY